MDRLAALAGAAVVAMFLASPASALTMAECSTKYNVAKDAGTLDGQTWNQFRKAECGADAAAASESKSTRTSKKSTAKAGDGTVPAAEEAAYTGEPERPSTLAPRGVRFPSAISRKYSGESPGKARMHTCLEQYYANKDADALNGLRWIQKGGGYYSLCNARLKS